MQSLNKVENVANQLIEIERYETKKLNMSALDEIVGKRNRYDGFHKFDVILTILFEFLLCLAIHLPMLFDITNILIG